MADFGPGHQYNEHGNHFLQTHQLEILYRHEVYWEAEQLELTHILFEKLQYIIATTVPVLHNQQQSS